MGWEAIDKYLVEAEKESKIIDQQVPQVMVDGPEVMQQATDFYTEEFMYNKPVPVCETSEQTITREDSPDLYDLDQEDSTFYPNENFYQCNLNASVVKSSSAPLSNFVDSCYYTSGTYVKPEPQTVYTDCAVRDYNSMCGYEYTDNAQDQYMNMKSKILDVCVQDVEETCRCLNISPDPHQWSHDNVQNWIIWQCRQYRAKLPNLDHFYISGATLCSMTEDKFKMFAPEAGSILFSRLVIWKSVVEQTTSRIMYPSMSPPPVSFMPVPRSPSLPPSPNSLSPTATTGSDTESLPSSPTCSHKSTDDVDRLPEEPANHHRQTIQLWQFLKLLLLDGHFDDCIRWVDRSRGIFKIENSSKVAKLWGKRKNRPAMNYDKLSRSIRQYYKKNIIKKTEHSKRLVYQFCHM